MIHWLLGTLCKTKKQTTKKVRNIDTSKSDASDEDKVSELSEVLDTSEEEESDDDSSRDETENEDDEGEDEDEGEGEGESSDEE